MNKEDVVLAISAGAVGFVAGQVYEQYKMYKKRNASLKKFNKSDTSDFLRTLTKYLNNPNDNRTVEQLVDDWNTNLTFNKIVENEK